MKQLVLISGPPGAGKTTIGRPIAAHLGWPYLEKDVIKEALFDSLGVGDEDWSLQLSGASFAVMFAAAGGLERAVLEGNFGPEHKEPLLELHPEPIQIFCRCDRAERRRRIASRSRHPGHVDDVTLQKVDTGVPSEHPLELGGPFLELDTSQPVDHTRIIEWIDSR